MVTNWSGPPGSTPQFNNFFTDKRPGFFTGTAFSFCIILLKYSPHALQSLMEKRRWESEFPKHACGWDIIIFHHYVRKFPIWASAPFRSLFGLANAARMAFCGQGSGLWWRMVSLCALSMTMNSDSTGLRDLNLPALQSMWRGRFHRVLLPLPTKEVNKFLGCWADP